MRLGGAPPSSRLRRGAIRRSAAEAHRRRTADAGDAPPAPGALLLFGFHRAEIEPSRISSARSPRSWKCPPRATSRLCASPAPTSRAPPSLLGEVDDGAPERVVRRRRRRDASRGAVPPPPRRRREGAHARPPPRDVRRRVRAVRLRRHRRLAPRPSPRRRRLRRRRRARTLLGPRRDPRGSCRACFWWFRRRAAAT